MHQLDPSTVDCICMLHQETDGAECWKFAVAGHDVNLVPAQLICVVCCQDAEGAEDSSAADAAEEATSASNTSTASKPPIVTRKETKSRKKTFRVPLTVAGPGFALPAMNTDQLKVFAQPTCMNFTPFHQVFMPRVCLGSHRDAMKTQSLLVPCNTCLVAQSTLQSCKAVHHTLSATVTSLNWPALP